MDFTQINNNTYLAGVSILMLNLGSRYIMGDIGKFLESILNNDITKKIVLFLLFFMGTRNVLTSLILTLIFSIIIYGIFNETSRYSLVPNDAKIKQTIRDYYQSKSK